MKIRLLSLLAAVVLSVTLAPAAQSQTITTEWMTAPQYQAYFDAGNPGPGYLPISADAGLFNGVVYFFARFERRANTAYGTHHAMSDAEFAQRDQSYRAQGYVLVYHQRFTETGVALNQGVWHR